MPYKFETDKLLLPKSLDRRVKLSDSDKEEIDKLLQEGLSNSEIARKFWVHSKTIYNIRCPDKLKEAKARYKENRLDWRYYNKEKQRAAIKEHRKYKKGLIDKLIKNEKQ